MNPDNTRSNFFVAFLLFLFWLLAFSSALHTGFSLIDDGPIFREVLRVKPLEGFLNELRAIWYQPQFQGGGRYTPFFWTIKLLTFTAFGYESSLHHFAYMLFSWSCIGLPALMIGCCTGKPWVQLIAFLAYFSSGDAHWGSLFWNTFDIATYDPLAGMGFYAALVAGMLMVMSRGRLVPSLATVAFLLSAFVATHSKESASLAWMLCLPIPIVGLALSREKRGRFALITLMMAGTTLLFFFGLLTSGAYAASRQDGSYASAYEPFAIAASLRRLGHFLFYLFDHGFVLYAMPALVFIPRVIELLRSIVATRSFTAFREIDYIALVLGWSVLAHTASVLPISILSEAPRLLFLPVVGLSLLVSLAPVYLIDFLPARCRIPRTALSIAKGKVVLAYIVISFLMLPFVPLRILAAVTMHRVDWGSRYEAVRIAEDFFRQYPSQNLHVMEASDSAPFRWGVYVHLENKQIENLPERFRHTEVSSLSTIPFHAVANEYGIILSKADSITREVLSHPSVRHAVPIRQDDYVVFGYTKSSALLRWLFRGGEPPWGTYTGRPGNYFVILGSPLEEAGDGLAR